MANSVSSEIGQSNQLTGVKVSDPRANEILEVVMAFARLNFNAKSTVKGDGDVMDAIAAGVNMLGEELESSVISLKEKEYLLKEIHHRVKNNLQIISSLLNLQLANEKDERIISLLTDCRNRVRSMSLIHEMLYASVSFSHIKFQQYLYKFTEQLSFSYSGIRNKIKFLIKVEDKFSFNIQEMIPLGLIINEIISNSFKHAFPEGEGKISIDLDCINDEYVLTISDNGIGLPEHFDGKKQSTLGMQLIYILAEQIDARVNLQNEKGVTFKIQFAG